MYKSEIRDSQKERLLEKARKGNYQKYLSKIQISKCRAFENAIIRFDFPVTALIGPNGGGKTTILGASGILYDSIAPRQFFTRNRQLDQEMKDWSISYDAIDRSLNPNDHIKRTAHFTREKWTRDAVARNVVFFGVSRTLPAVERSSLSRFANKNVVFRPDEITTLNGSAEFISKILGKDVSEYQIIQSDRFGNIQLLSGQTTGGKTYSEFHFGAGESSIIKMVIGIEKVEDNSMILIEEIENGLHPLATLRLVDYLIDVADRKKLQIIFTTHSEYAIKPLPTEAVWAAVGGNAIQGKLDILSLRSLIGEVNSELIVFVEDEFAKDWLRAMMRSVTNIAVDAIEIYAMGGDGTAVNANRYHNQDPSNEISSICVIDGDSKQKDIREECVFRLPGEAPELFIFNEIMDKIDEYSGILAVRCMRAFSEAQSVKKTLIDVKNTCYDHHLLFSKIGEKLGFVNEEVVRAAFLSTWCEIYPQQTEEFINDLEDYLPKLR